VPLDRVTFPVGALGCNCTIVSCPETREALVIDPGDEAPAILAALARAGLRAVKIVHTHAHFDHVMATGDIATGTGADVLLHHDDRWLYDNALMQTAMFGLARAGDRPPPAPTLELRGDETIAFGRQEARHPHARSHARLDLPLLRGIGPDPAAVRGRHAVQAVHRAHRSPGRLAARHQTFDPRSAPDPP
jgi:glyoxylase-like metal-dependent hydrolase (beta-lactamase superfamily II)